jgi:hypothetical protein
MQRQNAPVLLPNLCMIKLIHDIPESPYILVKTHSTQNKEGIRIWETTLVEYPAEVLQHGFLKEDGLEMPPWKYMFRKQNQYIETTFWRSKKYILYDSIHIPECFMLKTNTILPNQVYDFVYKKKDSEKKYHFLLKDIQTAPPTPIPKKIVSTNTTILNTKIPTHILRMYIEKAIDSKEECPITLNPFTSKTCACTPCGHLFDKEALSKYVFESQQCPTCRAKTRLEDIQTLQ